MAADQPILTLEEIDAIIDSSDGAKALLIKHWEWFVVQSATQHLKIRNNGGLNYRGLDVWISGQNRIATPEEQAWLYET